MTTEEKAKAYDKALEAARKELGVDRKEWEVVQRVLHNIFPELRESEDERVIKALETFINQPEIADKITFEARIEWLSWLDKQKEEEGYDAIPVESTLEYKLGFKAGKESEKQKPMYNLEIPAGDVAPAEEDGPFDEDEFLEDELSAFLQNYDKEYDDDAAVSDVAKHFYEIGKKQKEQKQDTRDADDLQLLGFIYDLLNEIEWKDNWAMSKDECLRRLNNYRPWKPVQTVEEKEYIRTLKSLISDFVRDKQPEDVTFYQKIYDWLEGRHIEQKPKRERNKPKESWLEKSKYELAHEEELLIKRQKELNEIRALKDKEQKPMKWSEEDMKMLEGAIMWLDDLEKQGEYVEKERTFLKSLPERLNLQPKQEWNEEDEKMLAGTLNSLKRYQLSMPNYLVELQMRWLKSLRPSWKPTYEQLEALRKAVNKLADTEVADSVRLSIMYDHLKELV